MTRAPSGQGLHQTAHESLVRDEDAIPASERSFGLVMGAVFAIIASIGCWNGRPWWPWVGGLAAVFVALALVRPAALTWLNRAWFRLGLLMHKVVNPVVMGLIFVTTVVPTGLVMQALRRDLLRLKRDAGADSYWIVRRPPGPAPETMKDQF